MFQEGDEGVEDIVCRVTWGSVVPTRQSRAVLGRRSLSIKQGCDRKLGLEKQMGAGAQGPVPGRRLGLDLMWV